MSPMGLVTFETVRAPHTKAGRGLWNASLLCATFHLLLRTGGNPTASSQTSDRSIAHRVLQCRYAIALYGPNALDLLVRAPPFHRSSVCVATYVKEVWLLVARSSFIHCMSSLLLQDPTDATTVADRLARAVSASRSLRRSQPPYALAGHRGL